MTYILATDVLLLADVFESFRETCIEHYGFGSSSFLYSTRSSLASVFEEDER